MNYWCMQQHRWIWKQWFRMKEGRQKIHTMELHWYSSSKCKQMYNDRKQIHSFWGWGGITERHEETSEMEGKVCSLDCANSFVGVYRRLTHIVYFRYVQFYCVSIISQEKMFKNGKKDFCSLLDIMVLLIC